jgi:hypothetical protein
MATLPTWDTRDWLRSWPALALACGLPLGKDGRPRIPCPSQQWKRGHQVGAPLPEALFVRSRLTALRRRLMGARDLIIDSAPILAWRRDDPDAAIGHAPSECIPVRSCAAIASIRCSAAAQACRSSFCSLRPSSTMLLPPDHCWNGRCACIRSALASSAWMPPTGSSPHHLDPYRLGRGCRHSPFTPNDRKTAPVFLPPGCTRRTRQTQLHRTLFWPRLPLFSLAAPSAVWLVYSHQIGRPDLHRLHCCRSCCSTC